MKVTKLAAAKGSLPEIDANLEHDIETNRNNGTDRLVAELGVPLVIVGQYDYENITYGKPGTAIMRIPGETS